MLSGPVPSSVPAGPVRPNHDEASKPGTPDSATVGTSGKPTERFRLVTAIALSLPARTCWIGIDTETTRAPPSPRRMPA